MAFLSIGYGVHYNLAFVIRNNFLIIYFYTRDWLYGESSPPWARGFLLRSDIIVVHCFRSWQCYCSNSWWINGNGFANGDTIDIMRATKGKWWHHRQNESDKNKDLNLLKYEVVWFLSSVLFIIFYPLLTRVNTYSSTDTLDFNCSSRMNYCTWPKELEPHAAYTIS